MSRTHSLLALGLLLPLGTPPHLDEVRCSYTMRQHCLPAGCEELPIGTAFLLSPDLSVLRAATSSAPHSFLPSLRRCDDKGCTPFEVRSSPSGAFLNVWKTDGGYILKIYTGPQDDLVTLRHGAFVEAATSLLDTYISYGRCEFGRAP